MKIHPRDPLKEESQIMCDDFLGFINSYSSQIAQIIEIKYNNKTAHRLASQEKTCMKIASQKYEFLN